MPAIPVLIRSQLRSWPATRTGNQEVVVLFTVTHGTHCVSTWSVLRVNVNALDAPGYFQHFGE